MTTEDFETCPVCGSDFDDTQFDKLDFGADDNMACACSYERDDGRMMYFVHYDDDAGVDGLDGVDPDRIITETISARGGF